MCSGLNPKKAGSFDSISQPGGGGVVRFHPPRISAAERRKIMYIGTYVNHVEHWIVSRKFNYTWNQSGFQIMANLC